MIKLKKTKEEASFTKGEYDHSLEHEMLACGISPTEFDLKQKGLNTHISEMKEDKNFVSQLAYVYGKIFSEREILYMAAKMSSVNMTIAYEQHLRQQQRENPEAENEQNQ
tara:strand:- start:899 stop:1228 length:330 start_codon:yes stop_codon:yes gene_type:complete